MANLPIALVSTLELGKTGALSGAFILLILIMAVLVIAFIVYIERAQRRILIQYPKRQVGMKMFGGDSSHLPLKLNTAGVIPPIFASSILLLPVTALSFNAGSGPGWLMDVTSLLGRGQPLYLALYISAIVFFAFFFTSVVFCFFFFFFSSSQEPPSRSIGLGKSPGVNCVTTPASLRPL